MGAPQTLKRSTYACYFVYLVEIISVIGGSMLKFWKARNESHFRQRFTVNSFVLHVGYIWLNIIIYDVYGVLCGSDILNTHTRSITFCFAGQFLQATLRIIVANASGENFNPYRRTTFVAWSLMSVNIVSFLITKQPLIDEKWLFRFINIMIWSAIGHFAYHVLDELKTILGIRIFHVIPKSAKANPQESATKTPLEAKMDKKRRKKTK